MTGRVLGAVLAGGASSRFGSDKAMAVLGGRTLLEHARDALVAVVGEVVVVGRGEIDDVPRAGLGPLGGIAGALDHARRRGFDSVVTIGCDMVRLPEGLLATLLERAPSYCADAPVLGHWPVAAARDLIDRLTIYAPSPRPCAGVQGSAYPTDVMRVEPWMPGRARHDGRRQSRDPSLSVRRWATDIGAVAISSPGPIANINTPADLPPP